LSNTKPNQNVRLSRRAMLQGSTLLLFGASATHTSLAQAGDDTNCTTRPILRIGLVTDLHYADKPTKGSRHYRQTTAKLAEAAMQFRRDKTDLVVELGDFIDAADSVDVEKRYLREIQTPFQELPGKKHYVLGNHCVDTLTKKEFLGGVGQEKSYYSFDAGGHHFIVLDSCFRSDGKPYGRKNFKWTDANIPAAELEWLAADLQENTRPTIVFAHQRLDVAGAYGVRNAPTVRKLFQDAQNVVAIFQGHSHKNDYREIQGIHYTTLVAMVEGNGKENNGYSVLDILRDGTLRLHGYRRQRKYAWS